jgi:hypothetical protein
MVVSLTVVCVSLSFISGLALSLLRYLGCQREETTSAAPEKLTRAAMLLVSGKSYCIFIEPTAPPIQS